MKEIPSCQIPLQEVMGMKFVDLLVRSQALGSKSEARRMIEGGGVYLNNQKVIESDQTIHQGQVVAGEFLLLGIGKKKKILICLV
ncbi:MAG: hypothetical protein HY324_00605 [Chlamydiia bacterium]|nr:hypothetical protein [Chlamydiia bacterium]